MRYACALFAMMALIPTAAASAANNSGGTVYAIQPQNGSGQHGTVALKPRGSKTVVEIHLLGAPAGPEPAHIHAGSCRRLNPAPRYPLTSITNGISETTVNAPISALAGGALAVNVHRSLSDLKTYVACGNLR